MKTIIIWSVFVLSVISSCQQADIEYYPIEKHHLGETYTSYTINNVMQSDSAGVVVFNFYPEEVTSLSYINYDEATCVFTFHRGETADYLISWDYETDGNYVEVQMRCGIPLMNKNTQANISYGRMTVCQCACACGREEVCILKMGKRFIRQM